MVSTHSYTHDTHTHTHQTYYHTPDLGACTQIQTVDNSTTAERCSLTEQTEDEDDQEWMATLVG